jgi:hypothetical protein
MTQFNIDENVYSIKCDKFNTIDTITLENGELRKQV